MSTAAIWTRYRFLPVGQGLFATGSLGIEKERRSRFRWVYDCGTSSTQTLLKQSIGEFARDLIMEAGPTPKLDLVAISHFDHDHISGLVSLLSKVTVGTLLLPYVPLWQRLVLAFTEGVDTQQALIQFFVNPVAYIAGLAGSRVERIVFVPSARDEGVAGEDAPGGDPPEGDSPWVLEIDFVEPADEELAADFASLQDAGQARGIFVGLAREGSSLRVARLWEFVPYNDAQVAPKWTQGFLDAVKAQRDALLAAPADPMRREALAALKGVYDEYFGTSARQRNLISLFIYAGPIGKPESASLRLLALASWGIPDDRWRETRFPGGDSGRCSVLYTGDGYLDTATRLRRLCRYLGRQRVKRISCLQVMHHGAAGNWFPGLAKRLAPDLSVFSSDPLHEKLGHPHAPVLRDFWTYGPVQVDRHHGVVIRGKFAYS